LLGRLDGLNLLHLLALLIDIDERYRAACDGRQMSVPLLDRLQLSFDFTQLNELRRNFLLLQAERFGLSLGTSNFLLLLDLDPLKIQLRLQRLLLGNLLLLDGTVEFFGEFKLGNVNF